MAANSVLRRVGNILRLSEDGGLVVILNLFFFECIETFIKVNVLKIFLGDFYFTELLFCFFFSVSACLQF